MTGCDRLGLRGFRWVVDKVREVAKEEKGEDDKGEVGRLATDDGEGRERRRGQERRAEETAKARQTMRRGERERGNRKLDCSYLLQEVFM